MKKIIILSLSIIVLLPWLACKKDKEATRFSAPDWVLVKKELHPYSMTAVIKIDEKITQELNDTDQLGAFVGRECRGKGVQVNSNGKNIFYLQIHGSASEQSSIVFQYYNAKSGHMYTSAQPITFVVDENLGTVDNPLTPELNLVK